MSVSLGYTGVDVETPKSIVAVPASFAYLAVEAVGVFDFILPEANGLHWNVGEVSRVSDSLYRDEYNNCYIPKLEYSQKLRLNDVSNIGLIYGDITDALTLNFYKIDGSLVNSLAMTIGDNLWTTAEWNWQSVGYSIGDKGYVQVVGIGTGVRATSECFEFVKDDCLIKLTYRNKFDKNRFGIYVNNTFRHIAYIPGKIRPDSSEDIESYIDSAGELTNTKTTIAQILNIETDNMPHYMAVIFRYAMAHSDLQLDGVSVKRDGVAESEEVDNTDMLKLLQSVRIVGQTEQFNF